MTYPSFNPGDILTASDQNAVGLWLVKTQTVGAGVSSVTVTDAFSASYDNYRIIYSNGVAALGTSVGLRFGASAANYFGFAVYGSYTAATVLGVNDNGQSSFRFAGGADPFFTMVDVQVFSPYLSKVTTISTAQNDNSTNFLWYSGRHADTNSYTSFTLLPASTTFTGGTIRVYGYRN